MFVVGEDNWRFIAVDERLFLETLYVVSPISFLISLKFSESTVQELIKFLCEGSNGDFAIRIEQEVNCTLIVAFYSSPFRISFLVGLCFSLNVLLQVGKVLQVVLDDFVKEAFCIHSLSLVSLNLSVQMVLEGNS